MPLEAQRNKNDLKKSRQLVLPSQDWNPALLLFSSLRKRRSSECGTGYLRPSWMEPLVLMTPEMCLSPVWPLMGHEAQAPIYYKGIDTLHTLLRGRQEVWTLSAPCQSRRGRAYHPALAHCSQRTLVCLHSLPAHWMFVTLSIPSLLNLLSECPWTRLSCSTLFIFNHI